MHVLYKAFRFCVDNTMIKNVLMTTAAYNSVRVVLTADKDELHNNTRYIISLDDSFCVYMETKVE